ncbi:MAG TPA: hypothetical protein QF708_05030 [Candidatus Poseidoniia archaeon]|nr:hypothetical protein [Candidatus Poseidoniia archaeon]
MKTFKDSFNLIVEKKMKLPSGEKVVKELSRLGKKKNVDAVISKKGSSFNLYVDGQMLDTFKSEKDAEKGLKEFIKVMGV